MASSTIGAADIEILVVKATSHDEERCVEKQIREIVHLTLHNKGYTIPFVHAISKRLSKTRDWIVALKTLILVHRALMEGDPYISHEILYGGSRKGARVLNMSDFRDEAHSNSKYQSAFVRAYSMYLEQKTEFIVYLIRSKKRRGGIKGLNIPVREMKLERLLERLNHLLKLIDRLAFCIPMESAAMSDLVATALQSLIMESFSDNLELRHVLEALEARFHEMSHSNSVIAFDEYVKSAKTINELQTFHEVCRELNIFHPSYYPQPMKITFDLETLKASANARSNPEEKTQKASQWSYFKVFSFCTAASLKP